MTSSSSLSSFLSLSFLLGVSTSDVAVWFTVIAFREGDAVFEEIVGVLAEVLAV